MLTFEIWSKRQATRVSVNMNKGQVWSAMDKLEVMRNHCGLPRRLLCTPPSMPTMGYADPLAVTRPQNKRSSLAANNNAATSKLDDVCAVRSTVLYCTVPFMPHRDCTECALPDRPVSGGLEMGQVGPYNASCEKLPAMALMAPPCVLHGTAMGFLLRTLRYGVSS